MPIVTMSSLHYIRSISPFHNIRSTLPLHHIRSFSLYHVCVECVLYLLPIGKTNPGGVHDGRLVSTMILFPRSLPSSGRRASRIAKTLLFRDMPAKKMQARILYLWACLWHQRARRRIYILYVRCIVYMRAGAEDAQEQEDSDPISGSCAPTA
jgi:hypothetical protein